jgi:hypothetical protein
MTLPTNSPSTLTPAVTKTIGVFHEMTRCFLNRPFLVGFAPPLAGESGAELRAPQAQALARLYEIGYIIATLDLKGVRIGEGGGRCRPPRNYN